MLQILVVEDNEINQQEMENQLSRLQVSYRITNSGDEALELWEKFRNTISLIFTDVGIRGSFDGLQLCSLIRQREGENKAAEGNRVFIAMLTARGSPEDRSEAIKHGCDVFLTKPVPTQMVIDLVNQVVLHQ